MTDKHAQTSVANDKSAAVEQAGLGTLRRVSDALAGRVAIVTGSAGGLGSHYAKSLAQHGCHVVLCDLRHEVHDVARQLENLDVKTLAYVADVAVAADVRRVVDGALHAFGRIDILINNAGIWRGSVASDDADKSMQDYEELISVNLKSVFMFGRAVIPHMIRQGGNIINIATDHVHTHPGRPTSGGSAMDLYDVSKWGVLGLTVAWASELQEKNIRVNSFSMGATDSPMLRGFVGTPTEEMLAAWMNPNTVCDLAAQLILEGPTGRTGENIGVWVGFEIELKPNPDPKPLAVNA